MLIECKRSTSNLTDRNRQQLAEYFHNHKESKVGILTNGIVYEFYSVCGMNRRNLVVILFMVFDFKRFHKSGPLKILQISIYRFFNPTDILEISEEKYFLDDFNNAFNSDTLSSG